ncbi:MAG: hypothetical protein ACRCWQ_02050 [Bacilli bacterium]
MNEQCTFTIKVPSPEYVELLKSFMWENECSLVEWQADHDCEKDVSLVASNDPNIDLEYVLTDKEY